MAKIRQHNDRCWNAPQFRTFQKDRMCMECVVANVLTRKIQRYAAFAVNFHRFLVRCADRVHHWASMIIGAVISRRWQAARKAGRQSESALRFLHDIINLTAWVNSEQWMRRHNLWLPINIINTDIIYPMTRQSLATRILAKAEEGTKKQTNQLKVNRVKDKTKRKKRGKNKPKKIRRKTCIEFQSNVIE